MRNKVKWFITKCSFVIRETYKADSRVMFVLIIFMFVSGLGPLFSTVGMTKLVKLFEQKVYNIGIYNYKETLLWGAVVIFSVALNLFVTNVKYSLSEFASYKLSHNIENLIAKKFQDIPQVTMDCPNFLDLYKNTLEQSAYAPLGILENLFNIIASYSIDYWFKWLFFNFITVKC